MLSGYCVGLCVCVVGSACLTAPSTAHTLPAQHSFSQLLTRAMLASLRPFACNPCPGAALLTVACKKPKIQHMCVHGRQCCSLRLALPTPSPSRLSFCQLIPDALLYHLLVVAGASINKCMTLLWWVSL